MTTPTATTKSITIKITNAQRLILLKLINLEIRHYNCASKIPGQTKLTNVYELQKMLKCSK